VGVKVFRVFNVTILLLLCVSILYPMLHVLSQSLSDFGAVARGEVSFYPIGLTLDPYKQVFKDDSVLIAYKNTVIITVLGTFFGVLLTSFVAYPLSRPNFMGRRFFTLAIALTLWFSGGMIPTFMVVKTMGIYNSLAAVIIPSLINTFNVIIMLTFFREVPQDLIDAARIDGCNEARILFQIVYPVSKPILATISLWVAVAMWNSFLEPLLYLQDRVKYPLQIILREIVLEGRSDVYFTDSRAGVGEFFVSDESLKAATVMAATIPIICIYPFLQKYFTKGVMIGSIKG
jgi:ABC-type glycerol-3-phosphate transport system permease component